MNWNLARETIRQLSDGTHATAGFRLLPYQTKACLEMVSHFEKGRRFVIIDAPTGVGKSFLDMVGPWVFQEQSLDSHIVHPTRDLQTQHLNSFRQHERIYRVAKGKHNYSCLLFNGKDGKPLPVPYAPCQGGGDSFCHGSYRKTPLGIAPQTDHRDFDTETLKSAERYLKNPSAYVDEMDEFPLKKGKQKKVCMERGICPYLTAREATQTAPIASLNLPAYVLWNTLLIDAPFYKPRALLVIDECHNLEGQLRDAYTLSYTEESLHKTYKALLGTRKDQKRWVSFERDISGLAPDGVHRKLKPEEYPEEKVVEIARYLNNVNEYVLNEITQKHSKELIAEMAEEDGDLLTVLKIQAAMKQALPPAGMTRFTQYGGEFRRNESKALQLVLAPVRIPQDSLKIYGTYTVMLSATIPDKRVFASTLGLDPTQVGVVVVPEIFKPAHRPIVFLDTLDMSQRAVKEKGEDRAFTMVADQVYEIMDHFLHQGIRGLVHVTSYDQAQQIHSRFARVTPRLLVDTKTKPGKAYDQFMSIQGPWWLMSPSIKEGKDFKGDLARVQIVVKCAKLPPEGITKRIDAEINGWYANKTATTMRQEYGRTTRSADDFSLTIYLDSAARVFTRKCSGLFTKEYHQAADIGSRIRWQDVRFTEKGIEYGK